MDKTYNFFKTKLKKENEKMRNNSRSNSSKYSYNKPTVDKVKPKQHLPLTKKQKQIREAIEYRYQKSKLRLYQFGQANEDGRSENRSNSGQMPEYKHLKRVGVVDLKEYHRKQDEEKEKERMSTISSQDHKKFNLRFKLKENKSTYMKTEGNESSQKNHYSSKILKNTPTPSKFSKKTEQWKFISIQLKQDLSKPKNRKTEVKINSHRSYNVVQNQNDKQKIKSNSSMSKYLNKVPKLKDLGKINRNKF